MPLRSVLPADVAETFKFGTSPDGSPLGADDFAKFYKGYAQAGEKVDVVVFGAPQLSIVEMQQLAGLLDTGDEPPDRGVGPDPIDPDAHAAGEQDRAGEDGVAGLRRLAAKGQRLAAARIGLDQGDVAALVGADHLADAFQAVRPADLHVLVRADDVFGGHEIAVR